MTISFLSKCDEDKHFKDFKRKHLSSFTQVVPNEINIYFYNEEIAEGKPNRF